MANTPQLGLPDCRRALMLEYFQDGLDVLVVTDAHRVVLPVTEALTVLLHGNAPGAVGPVQDKSWQCQRDVNMLQSTGPYLVRVGLAIPFIHRHYVKEVISCLQLPAHAGMHEHRCEV